MTYCNDCSQEISKHANPCPLCGAKRMTPRRYLFWAIVIGTILMYKTSFYLTDNNAKGSYAMYQQKAKEAATKIEATRKEAATSQAVKKAAEATIIQRVELTNFSWKTTAFDTIMEANFTLNNTNPFPIKDIAIKCQHSANSGTVIDSNSHTIYDIIPSNASKTFNDVNMGFIQSQASKSSCWVTSIKK